MAGVLLRSRDNFVWLFETMSLLTSEVSFSGSALGPWRPGPLLLPLFTGVRGR